jgi:hypothetical protein
VENESDIASVEFVRCIHPFRHLTARSWTAVPELEGLPLYIEVLDLVESVIHLTSGIPRHPPVRTQDGCLPEVESGVNLRFRALHSDEVMQSEVEPDTRLKLAPGVVVGCAGHLTVKPCWNISGASQRRSVRWQIVASSVARLRYIQM